MLLYTILGMHEFTDIQVFKLLRNHIFSWARHFVVFLIKMLTLTYKLEDSVVSQETIFTQTSVP